MDISLPVTGVILVIHTSFPFGALSYSYLKFPIFFVSADAETPMPNAITNNAALNNNTFFIRIPPFFV